MHPTPVLWPGESHGRRSLVGCSTRRREESDTTERLHFHFSLPCIGEGNGNPLQCSCLENPRDRGAWWGAVYGVAQSRTRLKRLSSSSSSRLSQVTNFKMSPFILIYFWVPSLPSLPYHAHFLRIILSLSKALPSLHSICEPGGDLCYHAWQSYKLCWMPVS